MTPAPVLEIYRHGRLVAIVVGWTTAMRLIPAAAGYQVFQAGMAP